MKTRHTEIEKITQIFDVSLVVVREANSTEDPLCQIAFNNKTSRVLRGAVLEDAFQWKEFIIVLVTDGYVFDESLNIYFFDLSMKLLDSSELFILYSAGIYRLHEVSPDKPELSFNFWTGVTTVLELLPRESLRMPILSESPGEWKPFGFRRRFSIRHLSNVETNEDKVQP